MHDCGVLLGFITQRDEEPVTTFGGSDGKACRNNETAATEPGSPVAIEYCVSNKCSVFQSLRNAQVALDSKGQSTLSPTHSLTKYVITRTASEEQHSLWAVVCEMPIIDATTESQMIMLFIVCFHPKYVSIADTHVCSDGS